MVHHASGPRKRAPVSGGMDAAPPPIKKNATSWRPRAAQRRDTGPTAPWDWQLSPQRQRRPTPGTHLPGALTCHRCDPPVERRSTTAPLRTAVGVGLIPASRASSTNPTLRKSRLSAASSYENLTRRPNASVTAAPWATLVPERDLDTSVESPRNPRVNRPSRPEGRMLRTTAQPPLRRQRAPQRDHLAGHRFLLVRPAS